MVQFLVENAYSATTALTLIVVVVSTVTLLCKLNFKTLLATGPWGVPVLGFFPFIRKDCHIHLAELAKKYGDAYLLTICGKLYIQLSSHKSVREAFVTKADDFEGRSHDTSFGTEVFRDSLFFENGESWKVQRKFWAQRVRDITNVVKNKVENPYFRVNQSILDSLRSSHGQPIDINKLIVLQCTKVFQKQTLGEDTSDDIVQKLRENYLNLISHIDYFGSFFYGRIARFITALKVKKISKITLARKQVDAIYQTIINDHKAEFDPNNPKDIIDYYLLEKKAREEKKDPQAKYFNDRAFASSLITIFGDGDITVGELISRYVKELVSRIDVQDAIYEEICDKIGTERFPTTEDRNELSYTNSVMKELERLSHIFPFFPSLECCRDTTISGVYCPKGTIAIFNFYAVNSDPSVYKNPHEFNPKRFLPDERTGRPREPLPLTFGIGKRSCVGEQMVSAQVFMFLTAILQHFILKPDTAASAEEDPEKPIFPSTFKAIAIPRDQQEN